MTSTLEFLVLALALPLGIVASPSFLLSRAVSPDNTCGTTGNGGNPSAFSCPTDLPCCSVNGWCGSTDDYCLTSNGCQGQFGTCTQDGSPPAGGDGGDGSAGNTQCGPDNGNASCASNECCSAAGLVMTVSLGLLMANLAARYCGTGPGENDTDVKWK